MRQQQANPPSILSTSKKQNKNKNKNRLQKNKQKEKEKNSQYQYFGSYCSNRVPNSRRTLWCFGWDGSYKCFLWSQSNIHTPTGTPITYRTMKIQAAISQLWYWPELQFTPKSAFRTSCKCPGMVLQLSTWKILVQMPWGEGRGGERCDVIGKKKLANI